MLRFVVGSSASDMENIAIGQTSKFKAQAHQIFLNSRIILLIPSISATLPLLRQKYE